jgi:hypothetical protein
MASRQEEALASHVFFAEMGTEEEELIWLSRLRPVPLFHAADKSNPRDASQGLAALQHRLQLPWPSSTDHEH